VVERAKPLLVDRGLGRSPEDATLERETDVSLVTALATLPPDMRVALLMAASGDGSAAIGAAIGRSEGATRTLICRARLRLREAMATEEGAR
jgi:DNA-directed RNA polymerase specialized sigma24 family protein